MYQCDWVIVRVILVHFKYIAVQTYCLENVDRSAATCYAARHIFLYFFPVHCFKRWHSFKQLLHSFKCLMLSNLFAAESFKNFLQLKIKWLSSLQNIDGLSKFKNGITRVPLSFLVSTTLLSTFLRTTLSLNSAKFGNVFSGFVSSHFQKVTRI